METFYLKIRIRSNLIDIWCFRLIGVFLSEYNFVDWQVKMIGRERGDEFNAVIDNT